MDSLRYLSKHAENESSAVCWIAAPIETDRVKSCIDVGAGPSLSQRFDRHGQSLHHRPLHTQLGRTDRSSTGPFHPDSRGHSLLSYVTPPAAFQSRIAGEIAA